MRSCIFICVMFAFLLVDISTVIRFGFCFFIFTYLLLIFLLLLYAFIIRHFMMFVLAFNTWQR